MALIVFGIALSLPLVIWGAGLLAALMNRYIWIVWLGGGVLGYVAGDMALKDSVIQRALGAAAGALHHVVPIVLGVIIMALGWWLARQGRAKIPENV
jgi:predicted tellurium resistance membrane protein TerC